MDREKIIRDFVKFSQDEFKNDPETNLEYLSFQADRFLSIQSQALPEAEGTKANSELSEDESLGIDEMAYDYVINTGNLPKDINEFKKSLSSFYKAIKEKHYSLNICEVCDKVKTISQTSSEICVCLPQAEGTKSAEEFDRYLTSKYGLKYQNDVLTLQHIIEGYTEFLNANQFKSVPKAEVVTDETVWFIENQNQEWFEKTDFVNLDTQEIGHIFTKDATKAKSFCTEVEAKQYYTYLLIGLEDVKFTEHIFCDLLRSKVEVMPKQNNS